MKTKIFSLVLSFAVMFGVMGILGVGVASAQTASFPSGCSSALGYSITTGDPCNGTNTATISVPGCYTALGYSTINGAACSGGDVAISYLAGCSSIYGYSVITGMPCNGTNIASIPGGGGAVVTPGGNVSGTVTTPGFPTTGLGGNAMNNIILLAASGLVASLGIVFLARPKTSY